MLTTLELSADATPQACADAVRRAWPGARVIHLKGVRPQGDLRAFYGAFFELVGHAHALAEDALNIRDRNQQRTGEVWFEVRYDPAVPDAYRHSANPQPLHTDGSYIPNFPNAGVLVCQAMPDTGGATTFIDGADVIDRLGQARPDLLKQLESTEIPHARSGDRRVERVVSYEQGEPVLNWNYYCVDTSADAEVMALRQAFFDFLQSDEGVKQKTRRVKLSPGEAVLWKDDRILHGRDGFDANRPSERFLWKAALQVDA